MKYLAVFAIVFPMLCYADNVIRVQAPISQSIAGAPSEGSWIDSDPVLSAWSAHGEAASCSVWLPDPKYRTNGQLFQQSRSCLQSYQRTHQPMLINTKTGELAANGDAIIEYKQDGIVEARQVYGFMENGCHYGTSNNEWVVDITKKTGSYLVLFYDSATLVYLNTDKNPASANETIRVVNGKTYRRGKQSDNYDTSTRHIMRFEICY